MKINQGALINQWKPCRFSSTHTEKNCTHLKGHIINIRDISITIYISQLIFLGIGGENKSK
jgi:hypothetical protein